MLSLKIQNNTGQTHKQTGEYRIKSKEKQKYRTYRKYRCQVLISAFYSTIEGVENHPQSFSFEDRNNNSETITNKTFRE